MRILMINVVCGIRSTGRICTDLATALEAQGHEVKIAYGREEVPEKFQKYAVRIGSVLDVKLHGVKARLLDGCGFGSKRATERFIDWVKEYNPDVIHLHNIHGYYINIEILFDYLRTCGKKIIWTLHDCWAFTGHTAYCDVVNCERWISGCYRCPLRQAYPSSMSDRSKKNWEKKKNLMDGIPNLTIVTPSDWLAGLVRKSFLAQYPVTVIHNGIDTSEFHPILSDFRKRFCVDNKILLLGVATTWDDMKGLSDYKKLAEMLDDKYRIILVGLSKKQVAGMPGNIIGIERTNSIKELVQIYTACEMYINLTYCDNYPTVNLEAIACGLPVITYRTGGSPESAINGIIVERGNLTQMVKEICSINKDEHKVDRIALSMIDKRNTVNKYLELIQ